MSDEVKRFIETASEQQVRDVDTPFLLDVYNHLTGKETARFSSRSSGEEQVLKALRSHRSNGGQQVEAEEDDPPEQTGSGEPAAPVEPKAEKAPKKFSIKLPFRGQTKSPKAGSKRARLLERMLDGKGVTLEEAMAEFQWERKDAYEGIRLIHGALGYGIDSYKQTGRLYAHTDPVGQHKDR